MVDFSLLVEQINAAVANMKAASDKLAVIVVDHSAELAAVTAERDALAAERDASQKQVDALVADLQAANTELLPKV